MAGRTPKILKASQKVKEQYLKELLLRVNDGTATKKDLDIITKLECDLAPSEPESKNQSNEFKTNVHGIAAFFGVTIRAVQLWSKNNGCPKEKHGMYDLKAVFDWWKVNIGADQDSVETEDIKQEYWRWQTEEKKDKVERAREKLIPKEAVSAAWAARVTEVCSGLGILVDRLPPLLSGLDRDAMRDLIEEEVFRLRDSYAREGKYCHRMD